MLEYYIYILTCAKYSFGKWTFSYDVERESMMKNCLNLELKDILSLFLFYLKNYFSKIIRQYNTNMIVLYDKMKISFKVIISLTLVTTSF